MSPKSSKAMLVNEAKANIAKRFFEENSFASTAKGLNTNGKRNRSVDGSGWHPSVTPEVAKKIVAYAKTFFDGPFLHLDIGTGLGYLPIEFRKSGIESYAVEGAADLLTPKTDYDPVTGIHEPMGPHPGTQLDRNYLLLADFSKKLVGNEKLKKLFDLSTSFEVIEHVHRKDQRQFWENLCETSKNHLCAIHVKNEEHELHCTIASPEVWEKNFDALGIRWKRLEDFPLRTEWDCSVFYFLEFPDKLKAAELDLGKSKHSRWADLKVRAKVIKRTLIAKAKSLRSH